MSEDGIIPIKKLKSIALKLSEITKSSYFEIMRLPMSEIYDLCIIVNEETERRKRYGKKRQYI